MDLGDELLFDTPHLAHQHQVVREVAAVQGYNAQCVQRRPLNLYRETLHKSFAQQVYLPLMVFRLMHVRQLLQVQGLVLRGKQLVLQPLHSQCLL